MDDATKAALLLAGFRPTAYREAHPDLKAALRTEDDAIRHFITHGAQEMRVFHINICLDGISDILNLKIDDPTKHQLVTALINAAGAETSGPPAPLAAKLSPLCNLLRLSFDTYQQGRAYWRSNAEMLKQIWLWHEALGGHGIPFHLRGVCDLCERQTTYSATPRKMSADDQFSEQIAWWEDLMCGCKMSTLDRAVVRELLDSGPVDGRVYHVGHHSYFRQWLSRRLPNVISSQYEEGRKPGETDGDIRYEDLTKLSFRDGEFDAVICMEILEHVPDYQRCLHEIARTLKPGGRVLLSFPWLGGENYDHLIRAEQLPDGSIKHLLPPEYHGDPAKDDGILCFRAFGWKILDELRTIGFSRASAKFTFGPLHGYMELQNPVIVAVR